MNKQLSISFEKILLKSQCGFQKSFGTQHYLLMMFEKWKYVVEIVKSMALR